MCDFMRENPYIVFWLIIAFLVFIGSAVESICDAIRDRKESE